MISIILLVPLFGLAAAGVCPKPEVIAPCTCTSLNIVCGPGAYTLKRVFQSLTQENDGKRSDFKAFILEDNHVDKLEENTFGMVTFETISLSAKNLSLIKPNAFENINVHIKSFQSIGTPFDKTLNIYEILSSMTNLEDISIQNAKIGNVPVDAFKPINGLQDKLRKIVLTNTSITEIGIRAFTHLRSLTDLDLSANLIETIPAESLTLEKQLGGRLTIDLSKNKLDENSFKDGGLTGFTRPTHLILKGNSFRYLEATKFRPFLESNQENILECDGIDCVTKNDKVCKSFWLVSTLAFKNRASHITCSDNKNIRDNSHFPNCVVM